MAARNATIMDSCMTFTGVRICDKRVCCQATNRLVANASPTTGFYRYGVRSSHPFSSVHNCVKLSQFQTCSSQALFRRISVEGVCISAPEVRMPAVEQERARSSAAPADPTPVPPEEIVSDDDPGSYFATYYFYFSLLDKCCC